MDSVYGTTWEQKMSKGYPCHSCHQIAAKLDKDIGNHRGIQISIFLCLAMF